MNYEDYFASDLKKINQALDSLLPEVDQQPSVIHEAMRDAVFPGGKRFRALLTLAACEAVGGSLEESLIPGASIELIHSYSLVHDDLPALDNDDLRRGKPTSHKKYGEDIAILTGDGLLTLAFEILAKVKPAERVVELLGEISTSSGTCGMIGGQVADLSVEDDELSLPMLEYIHVCKTGKLIKASAVSGAIVGGANEEQKQHILKYGELLGLAFQAVDDLLDGDGYLRLMKTKELTEMSRDLIAKAKREIKTLGSKAEKLQKLADYLISRIPQGNHV